MKSKKTSSHIHQRLNYYDNKYNKLHSSINNPWKRLIDILGGFVGLTITAILFIPLAILIYKDNPGPILYSQTRCGLNGKTFTIWKFRSMTVDAEKKKHLVKNHADGFIFKNPEDPRITKIGKILRSTSLDEFPQFWNVLTGDMSLVGTRPPTPDEVAKYDSYHLLRLRVKPGLTGEWQVKGRSKCLDFNQVVAMDLAYQKKWTVWYDLYLIFKTIEVVIKREGAC
ncbi:sugar transferase [Cyanobacterium stanieri]|uniref:sugar transferase n=1 Tax=Cyanobacterium stanieri TaxID=102235 RepID=UPI001F5065F3|nr:sugar transferase [Cyanobacterium stanieri]